MHINADRSKRGLAHEELTLPTETMVSLHAHKSKTMRPFILPEAISSKTLRSLAEILGDRREWTFVS